MTSQTKSLNKFFSNIGKMKMRSSSKFTHDLILCQKLFRGVQRLRGIGVMWCCQSSAGEGQTACPGCQKRGQVNFGADRDLIRQGVLQHGSVRIVTGNMCRGASSRDDECQTTHGTAAPSWDPRRRRVEWSEFVQEETKRRHTG